MIPAVLGAFFGDVRQGLLIGGVMGTTFAVLSQFFEPETELA
ncbi:hypothetical protein [Halobaculum rarum]